jgi:hypothetical protein
VRPIRGHALQRGAEHVRHRLQRLRMHNTVPCSCPRQAHGSKVDFGLIVRHLSKGSAAQPGMHRRRLGLQEEAFQGMHAQNC